MLPRLRQRWRGGVFCFLSPRRALPSLRAYSPEIVYAYNYHFKTQFKFSSQILLPSKSRRILFLILARPARFRKQHSPIRSLSSTLHHDSTKSRNISTHSSRCSGFSHKLHFPQAAFRFFFQSCTACYSSKL